MILKVSCPQCRTKSNVPASVATVRCPKCGTVWNAQSRDEEDAGESSSNVAPSAKAAKKRASRSSIPIVLGSAAVIVALLAVIGWVVFQSWPAAGDKATPPQATQAGDASGDAAQAADDASSADPVPADYRVVDLSETVRRQIYSDFRQAAASSVGKQIMLPKDAPARIAMEKTMKAVLDREIRRFAALHDVSEDDIRQIIAEGDAKSWD